MNIEITLKINLCKTILRMNKHKRKIELAVLSDLHLGTYGCHAKEILNYLKSIEPETLVLNGDVIDIWQFSKRYWPKSHHKVISRIFKMMNQGTKVYYITGNHDEMLRKFTDFELGGLTLCNKLILELDGKKTWFFHGDVFDVSIQHSKILAKLGGKGYDLLILINRFVNRVLNSLGREKISLSKKVKNSVKSAVKFISNFEQTAIEMAAFHGFDTVVCGHIHQPLDRVEVVDNKEIRYLNSGDWIENCSALEYDKGEWNIYKYFERYPVDLTETFAESINDDELKGNFQFELTEIFSLLSIKPSNGKH
jgi:UDP-2,3-diacylglucosamine pyrophosphatase LpxH